MTCNTAILRYNCSTSTLTWLTSFGNEPTVSNTTTEGAIEVNVPLLRDKPFFEDLSINTAARYTAYSTSGDYWTWKVGGDWKINEMLRLRATRSRDIRAPTLYELFAPPPVVLVSPTDLLTGKVSTNALSPDLSNKNLKAEIGDTTTAGFVLNPISHLSLSVDAYRITISNAITDVSGSTTAYQQACYASGGSSIWCTLQVRPLGSYTNTSAANTATTWYNEELNLSKIDTYGADFEGNYTTQLFNHPAMVRILAAYQPHAYYEAPGTPTIDQGGAAFGPTGYSAGAVWRLTGFFRVQPVDHVTLDVMERWRNPMKMGGDPTVVWAPGANSVRAFGTTNLTLTYDVPASYAIGQTQVYFNISNLFDAQAPAGEYSGNGARSGLRDGFVLGDDIIGRAFTIGAKLKL
jgi:outer membrane receptor protein involved in Fe transport